MSVISTLSVISRQSWSAGMPVSASTSATIADQVAVVELADRDVDRHLEPAGRVPAPHSTAWRQASVSTQRPSGTIRPVASAMRMKSSGETMPRVGCCQRTSASKPMISPVGQVDGGLVVQGQLVAVQGEAQVGLELEALDQAGEHLRVVGRAAAAAGRLGVVHGQVGVAHAAASMSVGVGSRAGEPDARRDVQLALADQERLVAAPRRCARRPSRRRPRAVADSIEHGELVAAEAGHHVALADRRRAAGRRPGPAAGRRPAWPRLSLTSLKPSRSRKSTVTSSGPRAARSASATRSRNSARLASWVSASWYASCTSWSCSSLRSLMSRVLSTRPPHVGVVEQVGDGHLGLPAAGRRGAARAARATVVAYGRPLDRVAAPSASRGAGSAVDEVERAGGR